MNIYGQTRESGEKALQTEAKKLLNWTQRTDGSFARDAVEKSPSAQSRDPSAVADRVLQGLRKRVHREYRRVPVPESLRHMMREQFVSAQAFVFPEVIARERKPLRPCRYPGCYELVSDGYCAKHQPAKRSGHRSAEAESWRWMYFTDEWRKDLRPTQLMREPFCRECAKAGRRIRATDVDHIVDHKGNWAVFCDRGNLESRRWKCTKIAGVQKPRRVGSRR